MMRMLRTIVAVFGFVGGIGFVRAGLWFFHDAGRAGKTAGELAAEGVSPLLPTSLYALAVMGIGLGLLLLGLSGREMVRLWRSGSRPQ